MRRVVSMLFLLMLAGGAGGAVWWYMQRERAPQELVLYGNMDLRLAMKSNVATDRPLQAADMSGGEVISLRGPWHEPFVRLEEEATLPR